MDINITKTKAMIFNKNGRYIRKSFSYGESRIESTRQYKYLGFLVTPSGEIHSGLKDLKDRALRAFIKIKKKWDYYSKNVHLYPLNYLRT